MNPLQRLITERLEAEGLSQRQACARTSGALTTATMSRVASGVTVRLTAKTINALATALDVRPSVVRAAAEATAKPAQLFAYTQECAQLPAEKQAEIIAFMAGLLKSHQAQKKVALAKARPFSRGAR